jgi:hypothetical protein
LLIFKIDGNNKENSGRNQNSKIEENMNNCKKNPYKNKDNGKTNKNS